MVKLDWVMRACGVFLLWAATAVALPAQTFTTLYSFCPQRGCADGEEPLAGLVQGTDGNLYGTTEFGGTVPLSGNVFKITTNGTLTSLYSFCSISACTDGQNPEAGLVQGTNGDFYGTTFGGGANAFGTIFRVTAGGKLKTLHSFDGTDGYEPEAGLVLGTSGKFYGTTFRGGANSDGTVFSITASGTLKTLHSFDGTDGASPYAGLVQGTNGDFYGPAEVGGANREGTVFKITPSGTLTTLYSFCAQVNCPDGAGPYAGLVQGTDGNFYGTTYFGGANLSSCNGSGCGTVFKITPSGTLTTLHSFCAQLNCTDGETPFAGLIQGTDGNFYGTTLEGGANLNGSCSGYRCGTVFEITPSGTLTSLYSFCSISACADGDSPSSGLVQDTNGTFYGTTQLGGASDAGTVFSLSVGLGPFVETRPTSGTVGTAVTILGTSLTGATSVTFNGTAATFTVVSASEITTTVPTGATTGKVKVVTPSGTLKSNVSFRVTQ
jgi:uncharacterized repeat protein (TIGR03803 family)